jgi:cytochrome d ubiquinol oxidase subunit I
MFWILSSNSWMQTPQGFSIENGIIVPQDWFAIVFNPSFPYRLAHMAAAAFLVSALLVAATAAWHLLKGRRDALIKKSFSMALWMILVLAPLQVLIGDNHGLNTLKHQPAIKVRVCRYICLVFQICKQKKLNMLSVFQILAA